MRELARIAETIESAQGREYSPSTAALRSATQILLQITAEPFRLPSGCPVEGRAISRKHRIDARVSEKYSRELSGESPGLLPPQHPEARDILVDFRLKLQLMERDLLVVPGVPREILKMTHTLKHCPEIGHVAGMQRT